MESNQSSGISLNKYISQTGLCSRREADQLIEAGQVTLNGVVARKGNRVMPGDAVKVSGKPLGAAPTEYVYLAYHKPVGVTCTTDLKDRTNIIQAINHPLRIFPVGRLDKESEGLIFLTNDGDIVNKILRASNNHDKEYLVTVDRPITTDFLRQMANGVPILDTVTQKCRIQKEGPTQFRIILTQGLNRQIRRMCEYLGYAVVKLKRVRIMHITLDHLPARKWRYLTRQEVKILHQLVRNSSKTSVSD